MPLVGAYVNTIWLGLTQFLFLCYNNPSGYLQSPGKESAGFGNPAEAGEEVFNHPRGKEQRRDSILYLQVERNRLR